MTALSTAQRDFAEGRYREVVRAAREIDAGSAEGPRRESASRSRTLALGAEALAELGDVPGALAMIARARALTSGDAPSARLVAVHEGAIHARHGEPARAAALLEQLIAASRQAGAAPPPEALVHLADAYLRLQRADDALGAVRERLRVGGSTDAVLGPASSLRTLALALLASGEIAAARSAIDEALSAATGHAERGVEGWVRLARAEVLLASGEAADAEQDADAAQELAEQLELPGLLERCRGLLRRLA